MFAECKNPIWTLSLICLCSSSGCFYGYSVATDVTALTSERFDETHGEVDLFFGGEVPKREFKKIAFIEVAGARVDGNAELLKELKKQARRAGAHAVMGIVKSHKERRSGSVAVDMIDADYDDDNQYSSRVFSGVAIRYVDALKTTATGPTPTAP